MDCSTCLANLTLCLDEKGKASCIDCMLEALNHPSVDLAQQAIAYYKMDTLDGVTMNDQTENMNDLTAVNGPTAVNGVVNNAINFVETSEQYLSGAGFDITGGGSFSMFFWFRVSSSYVDNRQVLIRQSDSSPDLGLMVQVNNNIGGVISVSMSANGTSQNVHNTTFVPTVDTWHSLFIRHNQVQVGITMDDLPEQTFAQAGTIFYSGQPFLVGAVLASRWLYGDIDELSSYGCYADHSVNAYLRNGGNGRTWIDGRIL